MWGKPGQAICHTYFGTQLNSLKLERDHQMSLQKCKSIHLPNHSADVTTSSSQVHQILDWVGTDVKLI